MTPTTQLWPYLEIKLIQRAPNVVKIEESAAPVIKNAIDINKSLPRLQRKSRAALVYIAKSTTPSQSRPSFGLIAAFTSSFIVTLPLLNIGRAKIYNDFSPIS